MNNEELMGFNIDVMPVSPIDAYIMAISSAIQIALQEHSKAIKEDPHSFTQTRGTSRILNRLNDYSDLLNQYRNGLTKQEGASRE
jgi:hypothetical protein